MHSHILSRILIWNCVTKTCSVEFLGMYSTLITLYTTVPTCNKIRPAIVWCTKWGYLFHVYCDADVLSYVCQSTATLLIVNNRRNIPEQKDHKAHLRLLQIVEYCRCYSGITRWQTVNSSLYFVNSRNINRLRHGDTLLASKSETLNSILFQQDFT